MNGNSWDSMVIDIGIEPTKMDILTAFTVC